MQVIGRASELAFVLERLRDRRLVSLVGPGGIGKTTLARAAAAQCAGDFGEGCRFVDLTRVDSIDAVRESVAAQLGYTTYRALIEAPGDHSVVLVVDNCEHVVEAAASVISELLEACQMPTVLATSRTALELPGEVVVPVGPLELSTNEDVAGPAVSLFVERARDAGSDIAADEVVAELCRRLDGVPLAIELAAARTRSMSPAEILERIGAGFDVLDRPKWRGARRHQSLRAAVRWSYDLLDDTEQRAFDACGVFSGPFTADLARAVASADHAVLHRLVAASMLVAERDGDVTWYRELDTLRTFAREHLDERGERMAVERRFVDHVVGRVGAIVSNGGASWSVRAFGELLGLYDNITAALRWSLQNDDVPDRALLLTAALWGVVHQAHTDEIAALAEETLTRWPQSAHHLHGDAVATAATCWSMLGDPERSAAAAAAAVPIATSSFAPTTLRRALGHARRAVGDTTGAARWFEEAADHARRASLPALAAEADAARAQILADLGDVDAGLRLVREARLEAAGAGADMAEAWVRVVEGSILLRVDLAEAASVLAGALATSRELGYAAGVDGALRCLASADLLGGDVGGAARWTLALLDHLLARGSTTELRLVFDAASAVLAAVGRSGPAADLAATALELPVVSTIASFGHELISTDPTGGRSLPVRGAILVTRTELALLATKTTDARETAVAAVSPPDERVGVFRRAGDYWEVGFAGELVTVRASKGMDDIAALLAAGREMHCLDLAGATVSEPSVGPAIDAVARRAYEVRVRELQSDIDDADAQNDLARAARARHELDLLVDELAGALGLGGRPRTAGGSAERARQAVTQRVRTAIKRIDAVQPRLARHLAASIRTGTFCSYEPEDLVRWQL